MNKPIAIATVACLSFAASPALAQFSAQEPSAYLSMNPQGSIYTSAPHFAPARDSYAAAIGVRHHARKPALLRARPVHHYD
jgi:hypothetical protein